MAFELFRFVLPADFIIMLSCGMADVIMLSREM